MEKFTVTTKEVLGLKNGFVQVVFNIENTGPNACSEEGHPLRFRPMDNFKHTGQICELCDLITGMKTEATQILRERDLKDAKYGIVLEGIRWIERDIKIEGELIPYDNSEETRELPIIEKEVKKEVKKPAKRRGRKKRSRK